MPSNLWKAESTSLELSVDGFPAVTRDLGEGPGGWGGSPPLPFSVKKIDRRNKSQQGKQINPPPPTLALGLDPPLSCIGHVFFLPFSSHVLLT